MLNETILDKVRNDAMDVYVDRELMLAGIIDDNDNARILLITEKGSPGAYFRGWLDWRVFCCIVFVVQWFV